MQRQTVISNLQPSAPHKDRLPLETTENLSGERRKIAFESDENWPQVDLGNLITHLDADIDKSIGSATMDSSSAMKITSGGGDISAAEGLATEKSLKMKIKRTKSGSARNPEGKMEIVHSSAAVLPTDLQDTDSVSRFKPTAVQLRASGSNTVFANNAVHVLGMGVVGRGSADAVLKPSTAITGNRSLVNPPVAYSNVTMKGHVINEGEGGMPESLKQATSTFSSRSLIVTSSSITSSSLLTRTTTTTTTTNLTTIEPLSKQSKINVTDASIGTEMGTMTEPNCLGPLEPGTSVTLEGIVWHETRGGVLVVNVTWRGRTYVGTLLDSTQHVNQWAPPRYSDSPTLELDSIRLPKVGRGCKRNRAAAAGNNNISSGNGSGSSSQTGSPLSAQVDHEPRKNLRSSKVKNTGQKTSVVSSPVKRKVGSLASASTASSTKKEEESELDDRKPLRTISHNSDEDDDLDGGFAAIKSAPDAETDGDVDNNTNSMSAATTTVKEEENETDMFTPKDKDEEIYVPPAPLPFALVCPSPGCKKKYRHNNGLRFHISHSHPELMNDNGEIQDTSSDAVQVEEEPKPMVTSNEDKATSDINAFHSDETPTVFTANPQPSSPCLDEVSSLTVKNLSDLSNTGRCTSFEIDTLAATAPNVINHSPAAYSDISDDGDDRSEANNKKTSPPNLSVTTASITMSPFQQHPFTPFIPHHLMPAVPTTSSSCAKPPLPSLPEPSLLIPPKILPQNLAEERNKKPSSGPIPGTIEYQKMLQAYGFPPFPYPVPPGMDPNLHMHLLVTDPVYKSRYEKDRLEKECFFKEQIDRDNRDKDRKNDSARARSVASASPTTVRSSAAQIYVKPEFRFESSKTAAAAVATLPTAIKPINLAATIDEPSLSAAASKPPILESRYPHAPPLNYRQAPFSFDQLYSQSSPPLFPPIIPTTNPLLLGPNPYLPAYLQASGIRPPFGTTDMLRPPFGIPSAVSPGGGPEDLSRSVGGCTKALDMLQQHAANQFYSTHHKIHELQDTTQQQIRSPSVNRKSPAEKSTSAKSSLIHDRGDSFSGSKDSSSLSAQAPLRHDHTHIHTHLYPQFLAPPQPAPIVPPVVPPAAHSSFNQAFPGHMLSSVGKTPGHLSGFPPHSK